MINLDPNRPVRFCPYCGDAVIKRVVAGRPRPHCPACQQTFFADPKLAVAVLIDVDGQLVLQRRAIEPGLGRWSFPSGFVERGERVEDAAIREAREEVGLDVRLTRLLGLYSESGNPVVLAVYLAEPIGGTLHADHDENDAVGLFSPDALPDLAFSHDHAIIADWRALRRAASTPAHHPHETNSDHAG